MVGAIVALATFALLGLGFYLWARFSPTDKEYDNTLTYDGEPVTYNGEPVTTDKE